MTDYIEVYDAALEPALCAEVIDQFNRSGKIKRGVTAAGADLGKKDSYDIAISMLPEWQPILKQVIPVTTRYIMRYMRKYAFTLVGAISTNMEDPVTGEMRKLTHEDIPHLSDEELAAAMMHKYRLGVINAQKYIKGIGGYHHWHSEHCPLLPDCDTLHRVLFFIYYLNTVEEGGETAFYYQNLNVAPRAGRLIVAPGYFTHTHKGNIPVSDDKYILTSWVMFNRAEDISGATR